MIHYNHLEILPKEVCDSDHNINEIWQFVLISFTTQSFMRKYHSQPHFWRHIFMFSYSMTYFSVIYCSQIFNFSSFNFLRKWLAQVQANQISSKFTRIIPFVTIHFKNIIQFCKTTFVITIFGDPNVVSPMFQVHPKPYGQ